MDRWLPGSKRRSDSIMSPTNSTRSGWDSPAGKKSTTPPRMQNSPCLSTGSAGVNPPSASRSPSAIGDTMAPTARSCAASSRRAGRLTRGNNAGAEATTTRARPRARAASARPRADATSRCGAMPRYGSTSGAGSGRMLRSSSAPEAPLSAPWKKRMSPAIGSTSRSDGRTSSSGDAPAAAAAANACAGGARPVTTAAGAPSPIRLAADLRIDRSVSDVVALACIAPPRDTWLLAFRLLEPDVRCERPRVRRPVDAGIAGLRLHAERVEQAMVVVLDAVAAMRGDVELVRPLDQVEAVDVEHHFARARQLDGAVLLDVGVRP